MFDDFLDFLRLQKKAPGTVLEYGRRLDQFARYLALCELDSPSLATTPIIVRYRTYLLKKNLSKRTINAQISTLCVYYNWTVITGRLTKSPVPNGLHLNPDTVRISRVTDDDLLTFMSWVDTLQPNLRAAFYLMIGSGARVGEVATLTDTDIILRNNAVYVNISDAKWGSDRVIPIVDVKAAKIVWDYKQSASISSKSLFRVSKRTLQTYATDFSKQTGIKMHCHLLRHTFASRLLEDGVPITKIQYLLGHKTVNMTAHYTQSARIDVSDIAPTIYQERGTISD